MKWAVLLGSPDISGGTYVIFEHTTRARRRGVEVVIVTEQPVTPAEVAWHPDARELTFKTFAELEGERFDIAIGTWWRTTFELPRVDARTYGYFVQSIESWFYDPNDRPIRKLADSSYFLGLPIITEATWIQRYLDENANVQARLVRNGIRKDIYSTEGEAIAPREPGRLRVLVEGPLHVPFKNVPRTIELCRRAKADEVWLLTGAEPKQKPDVDRAFVRVPIGETAKIYRSCDLIVKLSYVEGMFGPPLEMFHCGGTSITYDVTGHDEYIRNGVNALVATKDNEAQVVAYIDALKEQPSLLERLKAGALETARAWPSWEESSREFERAVADFVAGPPVTRKELALRARLFMEMYAIGEEYKLANQAILNRRLRNQIVEYAAQRARAVGKDALHLAGKLLRR